MFFERHVHNDKELPVYYQHQQHSPREPKYELHWHETLEWIYVTEGKVEIRIDEDVRTYVAGDLVAISPQSPHCFRAIDKDCAYYCMIPDNSILSAGGIELVTLSDDHLVTNEDIKYLFDKIIREYEEKKPYYKSCIRADIVLMIALLFRERGLGTLPAPNMGDNAMRITKNAIQYMEEHYSEEFSGEELAAHLGFSRSYLCHVISKVTGQSLTENLLYIRCRKAREFLRQGHSVGEVVYLAGFQNASYFCRTYKRMMGVAPSAHRKK
ncbi:MAG: helix-turn-helix transcriptional regulator [Clostridia bacterium]|nr:helix-turn-helix transcriptional regulator [Clostridia bacterium]